MTRNRTRSGLRAKYHMRHIKAIERRRGKASVTVGVLAGAGEHPGGSGATIAEVAFWNEFGTTGPRAIPARPFLSKTFEENDNYKQGLFGGLIDALRDFIRGKNSPRSSLTVLGERVVGDVKNKIVAIKSPPNAESTEKAKGFNDPLIGEHKALLDAISYEVRT